MNLDLFREFCGEIHHHCDAVICITTGGSPHMTIDERMLAVKQFKPELASVNMGSFNFGMFPMKARVKKNRIIWPSLEKGISTSSISPENTCSTISSS